MFGENHWEVIGKLWENPQNISEFQGFLNGKNHHLSISELGFKMARHFFDYQRVTVDFCGEFTIVLHAFR